MKLRVTILAAALVAAVGGTAKAAPWSARSGYAPAPYYSYNNGPWYDYPVPYSGYRSKRHRR
jgi:hypothetical protein